MPVTSYRTSGQVLNCSLTFSNSLALPMMLDLLARQAFDFLTAHMAAPPATPESAEGEHAWTVSGIDSHSR